MIKLPGRRTRQGGDEYRLLRPHKKRIPKRKKKECIDQQVQEPEKFNTQNETRKFHGNVNQGRKDKPRITI